MKKLSFVAISFFSIFFLSAQKSCESKKPPVAETNNAVPVNNAAENAVIPPKVEGETLPLKDGEEHKEKTVTNKIAADISNFSCEKDTDCLAVTFGCCDCAHGGKNIILNKKGMQEQMQINKENCNGIMCAQVISKDESCTRKAICKDKKCGF